MLQHFDAVHYYAFVLEAISRFGREGRRIEPYRRIALLRRFKPVRRLLCGVAGEMTAMGLVHAPMEVLEFGVFKGRSIRILSRLFPQARIHGFDTFSGFPADGRTDWKQDFAVARPPRVPSNVALVSGRFEDSLAPFLRRTALGPVRLIHIDCDIFSATRTVFNFLTEYIVPGTVLVFDELLNYDEFADNELLALYLFLQQRKLGFSWFVTIGEVFPFERACQGQTPQGGFSAYRNLGCYQNTAIIITPPRDRDREIAAFMAQARTLQAQRPPRQPLLGKGRS